MSLNTTFLLMAQYNGKAIIPIEEVRRDFFSQLTACDMIAKVRFSPNSGHGAAVTNSILRKRLT